MGNGGTVFKKCMLDKVMSARAGSDVLHPPPVPTRTLYTPAMLKANVSYGGSFASTLPNHDAVMSATT